MLVAPRDRDDPFQLTNPTIHPGQSAIQPDFGSGFRASSRRWNRLPSAAFVAVVRASCPVEWAGLHPVLLLACIVRASFDAPIQPAPSPQRIRGFLLSNRGATV